jgi:ABC-type nickel/cobalt efflux system permease component RcnA
MHQVRRLVAAALAAAVAVWIGIAAASAQTNPFTGAKTAPAAPSTATEQSSSGPGPFAAVGRVLLDVQRAANRAMAQGLRAVRDGEGIGAAFLAALALAFAYGVFHALGPGHGKFVVASYFLSRDARIGRGILMGTQIATMHVVSAVAIVVLADYLLRQSFGGAPAEVPAVRYASYGAIVATGLFMAVQALRRWRLGGDDHHHHHHHQDQRGHAPQSLLSVAVGLVPCSGAVLVLLYALANNVIVAGLVLAATIAIGMAITMSTLGIVCVIARAWMARRLAQAERPALRRLGVAAELAGALVIAGFGGALLATA